MKNITIVCIDSLRLDTSIHALSPLLKNRDIPHIESWTVKACNSCTEKSLPWMLSGIEVFSPTMSIPNDLKKQGYTTNLIHSNPIVDRFKQPFDNVKDLSHNTKNKTLKKKYNKLRHYAEKYLPGYKQIKNLFQNEEGYLPYTRIYDTLPHINKKHPSFNWIHLMDPHTPYYPIQISYDFNQIREYNNNQLSAVRGYYHPSKKETRKWYDLYYQESSEMAAFLTEYLLLVDYTQSTIIITSDHGEEFGEHGEFGHKGDRFHPENVDVPFVVVGVDLPDCDIGDHSELRWLVRSLID